MAVFIRAKHVTAPLDERVRARLRGEFTIYASSGSDHDGAASTSDDPSSLSALLNDFLESSAADDDDDENSDHNNDSDAEIDYSSIPIPKSTTLELANKLRHLLSPPPSADPLRPRLLSEVKSAAAAGQRLTGSTFRRSVMWRLRERGYNAGICKSRWDGGGGLTAGSYEYIDVVFVAAGEEEMRYIVDLGFAAEFEVARPTEEYRRVAAALPAVVVARAEEVRAAVRIMAEAARRSLKSRGMSVPPWRKKSYMMAKWLGFYRRTVNGLGAVVAGEGEVGWRAVGFGCGGDD